MRQIYLDHNATTKMEQAAINALLHFSLSDPPNFGNPSSIHWAGRRVKNAVDDARESVANAFGVSNPDEIFFTGSATEAINTALKGFFFSQKKEIRKVHFLSTNVEHEATLETLKFLSVEGAKCEILKVNSDGELSLQELEESLRKASSEKGSQVFLSLMVANNETGVIFPYKEAVELGKRFGATVHLDAVQAPGKIPEFSLLNLPVDLASFSAHKIGGPKGVGALFAKRGTEITALLHGGAQERKRRAGTMNVAGVAAFGIAADLLKDRDLNTLKALHDFLEKSVMEQISGVRLQGAKAQYRLLNTSNFLFEGVRGESLLMGLDVEGFAVSSGSACNSGSILPSHVLLAMGHDKSAAASACRVSLGPSNTREEVALFVECLSRVIERIRKQKDR